MVRSSLNSVRKRSLAFSPHAESQMAMQRQQCSTSVSGGLSGWSLVQH